MTSVMPTGVVTFVFTDIEGSTKLLQSLGDVYTEVLTDQRRLLREQWERWHGWEHGTEGDSFVVAFASPHDAVAAAVDAQRALVAHEWPGSASVRVRMGLHTGEPVIADDDYVGIDVHRAARIAASAHGGQIVLSKVTHDLVVDRLPAGVEAEDLGEYRLKDLAQPEWIYQLAIDGASTAFPPLSSLETPSNLLPVSTATIGRGDEVAALSTLMRRDEVRLVTVTGPGGAGKTRVAVEAAHALTTAFRNGVFFVPLGAVTDPSSVVSAIAQAVSGAQRAPLEPDRLAADLQDKAVLLVLDNFEHVAAAATSVAMLLEATRRLKVIVTSRTPLHLAAEREFPIEPLARAAAVALFVERARAARPGLELGPRVESTIAQICARLDDLPLAIELAAARVKTLAPEQVLERLGTTLDLRGRSRDVPLRQQTLRDTIAWSVDLLEPDARELFAQLAVFRGGATLDAIGAVGGTDPVDALEHLVEHSLVRVAPDGRFTMLATIREFASELLEALPGADALRSAHVAYLEELTQTAQSELRGSNGAVWRARLDAERANIAAALEWTLGAGYGGLAEHGAAIAAAMSWYWYSTGQTHDGLRWLELAREHAPGAPPEVRGQIAHGLAVLYDQAGRPDRAAPLFEQAHALFVALGDQRSAVRSLGSLGSAVRATGDIARAGQLYAQALEQWIALDDAGGRANAMFNLAHLALDAHDGERALQLLEGSLAIDQELNDDWGVAIDRSGIGEAYLAVGRVDDADETLRVALRDLVELDELDRIAEALANFAAVAAVRGDLTRAARVGGAAFALWERIGATPAGPDLAKVERYLRPARDGLTHEEYQRAWLEGQAMTMDQAVGYVLERPNR